MWACFLLIVSQELLLKKYVLYKVCHRPAVSFQNGEKKAVQVDETRSILPRKAGEMSPELPRASLCPRQQQLL